MPTFEKDTIFLTTDPVFQRTDAPICAVKRGEIGYFPVYTSKTAEELNGATLTPEVRESARAASMFGWNAKIADAAVEWLRVNNPKGA